MLIRDSRAAQYVRMSTDMQRYSIKNQSEAIAVYAARRGLTIVQSYEDAGRSGLRIEGRPALQELVRNVRSGLADFKTVLVYDVSRWGRFQDCDESAYYEFICRDSGVAIEYCAEQFENDGSITATILKNIKRAMAGEYSRELSVKVFAGQANVVRNGFHSGSTPGYGLRRCLVDENRVRKTQMNEGERKCLSTDRTILVPGPAEELEVINLIYDRFIDEKYSLCRIARELNDRGIPNVAHRRWNDVSVRKVLSNEKYIGNLIFNKTSRKLETPSRKNARTEWIESIGALESVVPKARFIQAQQQLKENSRAYLNNEMLDFLTAIWCSKQRLSAAIIDSMPNVPRVNAYKEHFGGLASAYKKIGYTAQFSRGRSPQVRILIMSEISEQLKAVACKVEWEPGSSQMLINEELIIAVVAGCALPGCGKNQWNISRASWSKPDLLVVARVHDGPRAEIEDYLLVPMLFLTNSSWLTVSKRRLQRMNAFRSTTLQPLLELCSQSPLGEPYG